MVHLGPALFSFVDGRHPYFAQVERFRDAIVSEPRVTRLLERGSAGGHSIVHTEIKGVPAGDGHWELDRFYWSLQVRERTGWPGFEAMTLTFAARSGKLEWHAFPEDPYLPGAGGEMRSGQIGVLGVGGAVEVLRYVPLRRLTARVPAPEADGPSVIAKFKRRSRWREAYDRLAGVARSVERAEACFAVAEPLGFDETKSLYRQSVLPGENLAHRLDEANVDALMGRVGAIHRELHELNVRDAPVWNAQDFLAGALRDSRWVAFCRPDCAELMRDARAVLVRSAPDADPDADAFCHGDFVCSQLLVDGNRWAVTDFDLCHRSDPYRDIAILLTSLSYDVPLLQAGPTVSERLNAAGDAYLRGYQERADRVLDRDRLVWYRLSAEITYLALALKKDWYEPDAFAAGLARVGALSGQLREREGCAR